MTTQSPDFRPSVLGFLRFLLSPILQPMEKLRQEQRAQLAVEHFDAIVKKNKLKSQTFSTSDDITSLLESLFYYEKISRQRQTWIKRLFRQTEWVEYRKQAEYLRLEYFKLMMNRESSARILEILQEQEQELQKQTEFVKQLMHENGG